MKTLHALTTLIPMLEYDFMRNALMAGTIAAIIGAIVGYFVVIRSLAFAAHALSHVSFAGAVGAGLLNLNPIVGQLAITLLGAAGMGKLGARINKSDIAIGIILAFSLGLGVLFLSFYQAYAAHAFAILFGDLFSVSSDLLMTMLVISILCLIGLAIIARPLLFASLEPELAEAKGVSLSQISAAFLIILAITVTAVSQVIGVLLVFTLLIGPAAAAINWTRTFWPGIGLALILALAMTWLGILLAYFTDWPPSFWICTLSLVIYLLSLIKR